MPRGRRDGRELYYVSTDREIMAVSVTDPTENTFGSPQPLFPAPLPSTAFGGGLDLFDSNYDGTQFFLITDDGDSRSELPAITVIVNWLTAPASR